MRIFSIQNDRIVDQGVEVSALGWKAGTAPSPFEYERGMELPWTRYCTSIGDWGIVSALPRLLSDKYPGIKFLLPTPNYIRHLLGSSISAYQTKGVTPENNVDLIFANNPYVEGRFDVGDFDSVMGDHFRSFMWHDEPLIEKLMRAFGFTEEEISTIPSGPELYFSAEEVQMGEDIINKAVGTGDFVSMILASRISTYNNEWPANTTRILRGELYEKYNHLPVFYYSSFDVESTSWGKIFSEYIAMDEIPLRVQLYIKSRSIVNTGYQAGISDAVAGMSPLMIATPYERIGDNAHRGSTYYFPNGSKLTF